MTKIFIDGSSGTTGLRIRERLCTRKDIELITLEESVRKDAKARQEAFAKADIAFLCLPDAAAIEAVELAKDSGTVIIDTSTAHRTAPGWEYGMPELTGRREKIAKAGYIANPGCHASGFIALVAPLVEKGLLAKDALLTCFSLTGYSGGGKNMIADYEDPQRSPLLKGPRQYALGQTHKHLKEMNVVCGLENSPVFCPIVGDFYSGMEVTVPLFKKDVKGTLDDIRAVYAGYYPGPVIRFNEAADEKGFLSAAAFTGKDDMEITVCGNEERILLVSRFDNLGKGASGAAIQNMNIVLGLPETEGLEIQ
ncbi:MAG: N-acetyl-gamma-glutamyl-phosphate reductase [Acidaminococcaceae bacterium]|nr:N-acetyl-gamma-glutamyl-phosphate reductase [Acidaminococcaceae bacterium]